MWTCLTLTTLLWGRPSEALAITLGQVDDFEDGTTQGWADGSVSPNPPVNVPEGGPGTATAEQTLSAVNAVRLLAAAQGPSWTGDQVAATVGIDAVTALRGPAGLGDVDRLHIHELANAEAR